MAQTGRLGPSRVGAGGRDVVCMVPRRLRADYHWFGNRNGALRQVAVLAVNKPTHSDFSFVFLLSNFQASGIPMHG